MFAGQPGKGITLEMYIRNTQVNNNKKKRKKVSWTKSWRVQLMFELPQECYPQSTN